MARGISEKTKKITLGAILSAMGVALLFVGSVVQVLDLSAAAFASFFCIFAVIELGGAYPWLIYFVTGILSVILTPYGSGGWFYILFLGYYPIIKEKLERLRKPLAWLIKLIILNLALWVCVGAAYLIMFGGTGADGFMSAFSYIFGDSTIGGYMAAITYLLVNVVFVVYDIALTRLITFYIVRLRKRFKFLK